MVAIIGILASVAYPSYQEFVKQGRRADAQGSLMNFAGAMERHFTVNNTYVGVAASSSFPSAPSADVFYSQSPKDGTAKYYDLEVVSEASTSFSIQAVPISVQVGDFCGTMTVDHTGARTPTGSDCWR